MNGPASPLTRIAGGHLVTATGKQEADLDFRAGRIVALWPRDGETPPPADETIDAGGTYVLPGAIDAHTHFGMPLGGGRCSLGWRESSEAALLGGTTTVVDFANPERGEPLPEAVERWRAMADGTILCDYGLHCTVLDVAPERLDEIPQLIAAGIPTFKGFLAYPGRLMLDREQMRILMRVVARHGGLLLVHAEDGAMNTVAQKVLLDVGRTGARWHPLAHPARSETLAVQAALELARETGCRLEIVHASLGETVEQVREARSGFGQDVLLEVCLHHLFLDESLYLGGHSAALAATCSPPLRAPENGERLMRALAEGDVDLLSTDHCEFDLGTKLQAAEGGFPAVPNGCGGVGERLTISYSLGVVTGKLDLGAWIQSIATRPARLMGLGDRKGRLAAGYDADIVLFDPAPEYRWEPLGPSDRRGSIWAGMPVCGRVRDVWLRGRQVVAGGRLTAGEATGRYLERRL